MSAAIVTFPRQEEALGERIVVESLMDSHGREWCRLPPLWVTQAGLCSATAPVRMDGQPWQAACRERSEWQCFHDGELTGLCAHHMKARLEVGA
jgi:hypothetical protein